jgi:hypothetical protein
VTNPELPLARTSVHGAGERRPRIIVAAGARLSLISAMETCSGVLSMGSSAWVA